MGVAGVMWGGRGRGDVGWVNSRGDVGWVNSRGDVGWVNSRGVVVGGGWGGGGDELGKGSSIS